MYFFFSSLSFTVFLLPAKILGIAWPLFFLSHFFGMSASLSGPSGSTGAPGDFSFGFISVVKHSSSYGFIDLADSPGEIFFHFNELRQTQENLKAGMEVKFISGVRGGRPCATRIESLPSGSLSREVLVRSSVSGVVERALRFEGGGEGVGGLIKSAEENAVLQFSERDLSVSSLRHFLRPGDFVIFDIFRERKSGRQGATAVRLEAPGGLRIPGLVTALKDSFGFMKIPERARASAASVGVKGRPDIFFHFSEILGAAKDAKNLNTGDCFEFSIAASQNGVAACRLTPLPRGSVTLAEVEPAILSGRVLACWKYQEGQVLPGELEYEEADSVITRLPLLPSCVKFDKAVGFPVLLPGDLVNFQLSEEGGEPRKVQLTKGGASKIGRTQGIISSVREREGFCFIDVVTSRTPLFLGQRQLKEKLAVGQELEFDVFQEGPTRFSAVRPVVLPRGSVQFQQEIPGIFEGIVTTEGGKVKITKENKEEKERKIDIAMGTVVAIEDSSAILLSGDSIKFRLLLQRQTASLRAIAVELVEASKENRERGRIISMIRDGEESLAVGFRGKLLAENRVKPLNFQISGEAQIFKVGDCVEFNVAQVKQAAAHHGNSAAPRLRDFAVRMTALPENAVIVENPPTGALTGRIAVAPTKNKAGSVTVEGPAGHALCGKSLVLLPSECGDEEFQTGDGVALQMIERRNLQQALPRAAQVKLAQVEAAVVELGGSGPGTLALRHSSERVSFQLADFLDPPESLKPGDRVAIGRLQGKKHGNAKRIAKQLKFLRHAEEASGTSVALVGLSRFSAGPPNDSAVGFADKRKNIKPHKLSKAGKESTA